MQLVTNRWSHWDGWESCHWDVWGRCCSAAAFLVGYGSPSLQQLQQQAVVVSALLYVQADKAWHTMTYSVWLLVFSGRCASIHDLKFEI
jgi:hypothetical protein